jgi:NADH-quinone oxidoreductase subunit I
MGVIKVAQPPQDNNIFQQAWGYISTIAIGMGHTMGIFFKQLSGAEKSQTLEWPEQPATYGERFKGKHFLTLRDDGQVRCTACFLCATACPAKCIHIEAGQHPDNEVEKFPVRFEIDILRCVFCGFCEEACPVDAIRLGPEYVMAGQAGDRFVYTKDYLAQRTQLRAGVNSVKDENEKHPTIDHEVASEPYRAVVAHGGVHDPH